MKPWRIVLAAFCGVIVVAGGVMSANVSHKMRQIFEDLLDGIALPAVTNLFLSTPRIAYLLIALLIATMAVFLVLKAKRASVAVAIFALTGFLVVVYAAFFSFAMFSPISGEIIHLNAGTTNQVGKVSGKPSATRQVESQDK